MKRIRYIIYESCFILVFMLTIFLLNDNIVYAANNDLEELKSVIKQLYVNDIDDNDLRADNVESLLNMVGDPYSKIMSKDEYLNYSNEISNNVTSIGVYFDINKLGLKVIKFSSDSPAYKAGIRENDIIVEINDHSLYGMPYNEAISYINGKVGTLIKVKILRENLIYQYIIMRGNEYAKSISNSILDNNVGYIKISVFSEKTGQEFRNAILELNNNVDSYVLDLRDNPGGYISALLDISGYFMPNRTVVNTLDRISKVTPYLATKHDFVINKPVIILVNKKTASSAEIFAVSMRENYKAIIIGDNTFGKGTEQGFVFLSSGNVVKLSVRKMFSPSMQAIDKIGIKPDVYFNDKYLIRLSQLLLSNTKSIENKKGYIIFALSKNMYSIDLKKAITQDYWNVYKEFLNTINNENYVCILGRVDGWVPYTMNYSKNPWSYFYPSYQLVPQLNDVPQNKVFSIKFNWPVNPNTVNSKSIKIIDYDSGVEIESNLYFTSNQTEILVRPENDLPPNRTYLLIISEDIKSRNNSSINSGYICPINIK